MPNLNAALGLAQLEELPDTLAKKRQLHSRYAGVFESLDGLSLVQSPEWGNSNFWINCVVLDDDDLKLRDELLRSMNEMGYQSRPLWQPMHELPMYRECPRGELTHTESIYRRAVCIPSAVGLVGPTTSRIS